MFKLRDVRKRFQARLNESMSSGTDTDGYRRGSLEFVRDLHEALGVRLSEEGRPEVLTDDRGVPYKAPGSARASELSLRALAEGIMGHEFVEEYYHPSGGFDFSQRGLLEAAVDPTAFVNINTFNLATAGLVNAEIMERYDAPDYIGRSLITVKPTNMNGHKRIGVAKIAPVSKAAKGRQPGETHAEIGLTEMWQTTPVTVEQALKCMVTREAVYFDLTNQVLETAGMVGDELAYQQEKDIADEVMGVSNSYNFNGTSYNTYQTASPYVNDQSNVFADYASLDTARQLFVSMTDPVTGREIKVNGLTILGMPQKQALMQQQLYGPQIMIGTQLNSNFPSVWTQGGPNPVGSMGSLPGGNAGGKYNLVILTPIWYNRATAADGLNLSAANAQKYWWVGDFSKAVEWHENWPATPWQASADELTMKDRGLIAVYGMNYRGAPFTKEPRYEVRNKN